MPARTLQRSIPTEHSARRVEGEARISRDRRDLMEIPRTTIWDLTRDGFVKANPSYAVAKVRMLVAKDLRSLLGQSLHYI